MLWRQGDVFIEDTPLIPGGARQQASMILVEGELTGHAHRIADPDTAIVYERRGELFLQVIAELAEVIHQEHATIRLPRGRYRVWRQREYDPAARQRSLERERWARPQWDHVRWVAD
jgi:hypothetical protein